MPPFMCLLVKELLVTDDIGWNNDFHFDFGNDVNDWDWRNDDNGYDWI